MLYDLGSARCVAEDATLLLREPPLLLCLAAAILAPHVLSDIAAIAVLFLGHRPQHLVGGVRREGCAMIEHNGPHLCTHGGVSDAYWAVFVNARTAEVL